MLMLMFMLIHIQVLTDLLSIMTVTNSRAPCEAKVGFSIGHRQM